MTVIGISGQTIDNDGNKGSAGAGKDTVCSVLVEVGFQSIALADALKQIVLRVFGFDIEPLWGSSELRDAVDQRYSITPRHALQTLGTWGRECHNDIWVDYALRLAADIQRGGIVYDKVFGPRLVSSVETNARLGGMRPKTDVCFSDVRYKNEMAAIRNKGGLIWRVVRPVDHLFTDNSHQSENDLNDIGDSEFDAIIYNDRDFEGLRKQVERQLVKIQARGERQKTVEHILQQTTILRLGDDPLK